ncbi:MAG: hypothetical protein HFG69_05885 [Hungatella sp.]|nr:hypothetical protein [Hungatella sp.]
MTRIAMGTISQPLSAGAGRRLKAGIRVLRGVPGAPSVGRSGGSHYGSTGRFEKDVKYYVKKKGFPAYIPS